MAIVGGIQDSTNDIEPRSPSDDVASWGRGDDDSKLLRRSPGGAIPHSVSIRLDADGMAYAGDPAMFCWMT